MRKPGKRHYRNGHPGPVAITTGVPLMKKKHIIICLCIFLLLLAIAVAALHPAPRNYIRGWVNGESFYQGRPTSYWSDLIVGQQEKPFVDNVCDWFGVSFGEQPKWFALSHDGDPKALPVLRELLHHPNVKVREMACRSLQGLAEHTHDQNLPEWKAVVSEALALQKQDRLDKAIVFDLAGEIGPAASEASPLLEATVKNSKERLNTRLKGAAALCRLDPRCEAAIAVMVQGVQSQNDRTCGDAINILWSYVSTHPAESEELVKPRYPAIKAGLVAFLERNEDDDPAVNLKPAKQLLQHIAPDAAKGGAN
jgi:hypothetical protein